MKLFKATGSCLLLLLVGFYSAVAQIGSPKTYENAAVVAGEPHAAKAGVQILKKGGNAVDAAVAVQFAMAVTQPRAGNLGGGGFMIARMGDETVALDFRERAPFDATHNMYIKDGKLQPMLSREGALAVGVPGSVAGVLKAHKRYGKLPLKVVMQPAIKLASEGFHISLSMAQLLNENAEAFAKYDGSEHYFTKKNDELYREGDLFVQKDLAKTLERIVKNGREGFYSGPTADMIVKTMEKYDGLITHKDLKQYKAIWRKPLKVDFHGYTLYLMPPPSSGGVAIAQMLTMLDPYNLKDLGYNTAKYVHLVTEVMRRAFADRAYFLGDPDYTDLPMNTLLGETYLKKRMESFDWEQATSSKVLSHGKIPEFKEEINTTHYSVVDKWGNAVSITTTLNGWFGSKVAVDGAGFFLNNEMDDFAAKPGEPNMYGLIQGEVNAVEPGKRMLSSMIPTIVTKNDEVSMVLGAAGGPRIITAVFQIFLNGAVFGMNAQEAVSAPRFHHQWYPDYIRYEDFGINKTAREKLKEWGHTMEVGSVGRAHIIFVDDNGVHGAPDPRGNGFAAGY